MDDFLERREVVGEFRFGQRGTGVFADILQGSVICPKLEIPGKLQSLGFYMKKPPH